MPPVFYSFSCIFMPDLYRFPYNMFFFSTHPRAGHIKDFSSDIASHICPSKDTSNMNIFLSSTASSLSVHMFHHPMHQIINRPGTNSYGQPDIFRHNLTEFFNKDLIRNYSCNQRRSTHLWTFHKVSS